MFSSFATQEPLTKPCVYLCVLVWYVSEWMYFSIECVKYNEYISYIVIQVNFNEPLSFLQRLNEDLFYHDVLTEAVKVKRSCEQICYVAAFASSSYASTVYRTGKPFNPLLGETYECDRRCEMGWRSLTEQVSIYNKNNFKILILMRGVWIDHCYKQ